MMDNNLYIRLAAAKCQESCTPETMITLIQVLRMRMREEGMVLTPMIAGGRVTASESMQEIKKVDTFTPDGECCLEIDTVSDEDGNRYFPLFTSEKELDKGEAVPIRVQVPIRVIIENGYDSTQIAGVVIDPFGEPLVLPKQILGMILA